jgi:hypothetical protein
MQIYLYLESQAIGHIIFYNTYPKKSVLQKNMQHNKICSTKKYAIQRNMLYNKIIICLVTAICNIVKQYSSLKIYTYYHLLQSLNVAI